MIVAFSLILSIIGLSLAFALYSNIIPYFFLLKDIKQYNMAYYGANTALERSLLVLRYRDAWFEWAWWRMWEILNGPQSDLLWQNNFGYYTVDNYIHRSIGWRTNDTYNTIPFSWKWNANQYALLTWDDDNYNKLAYGQSQKFLFRYDSTSSENAYNTWSDITHFSGQNVDLLLELPNSIKHSDEEENKMCDNEGCWEDLDQDWLDNDVMVAWRFDWYYKWEQFSIFPRILMGIEDDKPLVLAGDMAIRKNIIWKSIGFSGSINPVWDENESLSWHLMIGSTELVDEIWKYSFSELYTDPSITWLSLSLIGQQKIYDIDDNIYPYLRYKLTVWDNSSVAQPFFDIIASSKVWPYTVSMNVRKSVDKKSIIDLFTVIF